METISPFAQGVLLLTAIVLTITLILALRDKIIFKMSLRNAFRRKSTTILVIVGSMVGTALITGSQVINDSFQHTADVAVEDSLGEVDLSLESELPYVFTEEKLQALIEDINELEDVDDTQPINAVSVSIQQVTTDNSGILKGLITALSGDWDELNNFGSDPTLNNKVTEPEKGSILIANYIAESLDVEKGDEIRIFLNQEEHIFEVQDLLDGRGVSGYMRAPDAGNIILNSEDFRELTGIKENEANSILVSHVGGLYLEDYKPEEFTKEVEDVVIANELVDSQYVITERKDMLVSMITENGTDVMFSVLSVFGIFAGALLIINIYSMLADERKSEMGMLRAIAFTRGDLVKAFSFEGLIYSTTSSFVGVIVGIGVGYVLVTTISSILNTFLADFGVEATILFGISPTSLIISFSLGLLITYLTIVVASFFISRINIVSAIRDTEPEPKVTKLWVKIIKLTFAILLLFNGVSTYLMASTVQEQLNNEGVETVIDGYLWYVGFAMITISLGLLIKWLCYKLFAREFRPRINRIAYSLMSLALFIYSIYAISADKFKDSIIGNPGYIFIVGIGLVFSLTMLVTYNVNIISDAIRFVLSPFTRLSAVIKIALKYPAENTSRTGLTLAMYALIIFIVIFISIYRSSLNTIFVNSSNSILAGFDGAVFTTNPENVEQSNEILDEAEEIDLKIQGESFFVSFPNEEVDVDAAGLGETGPPTGAEELAGVDAGVYKDQVYSASDAYLDNVNAEISKTIDGLAKEDVWKEFKENPDAVVITGKYAFKIPGLPSWEVGDEMEIQYPGSEELHKKTIIAVIGGGGFSIDLSYGSIIMSTRAINEDLGDLKIEDSSTSFLFNYKDGTNVASTSKEVKQEFAKLNEYNIIIAEELTVQVQALINQFIYLMQGFLSFGLLVGLAGLAVILTRSVNERRQQIGMLRSLGFKRSMIMQSFLLEASLIGLLGIAIGVIAGTIGGVQLITVETSEVENFKVVYPTLEIIALSVGIYLATLLFAWLPALKASRLEPVEATNYPE